MADAVGQWEDIPNPAVNAPSTGQWQDVPNTPQPSLVSSVAKGVLLDPVVGAAKGALSTMFHAGDIIRRAEVAGKQMLPDGVRQWLDSAPQAVKDFAGYGNRPLDTPAVQAGTTPEGTGEKLGYYAEHIGEYAIPGATEGTLPVRMIGNALKTGAVAAAQTGADPEATAEGAIGGALLPEVIHASAAPIKKTADVISKMGAGATADAVGLISPRAGNALRVANRITNAVQNVKDAAAGDQIQNTAIPPVASAAAVDPLAELKNGVAQGLGFKDFASVKDPRAAETITRIANQAAAPSVNPAKAAFDANAAKAAEAAAAFQKTDPFIRDEHGQPLMRKGTEAPEDPEAPPAATPAPTPPAPKSPGAPDAAKPPAGPEGAIVAPDHLPPKLITEGQLQQWATDNGISVDDAEKQLLDQNTRVIDRPTLNRTLHAIAGSHEALKGMAGVDSLTKLSDDQMLKLVDQLSNEQAAPASAAASPDLADQLQQSLADARARRAPGAQKMGPANPAKAAFEANAAKAKAAPDTPDDTAPPVMIPLQLSDTFAIKEQIKALGGKWDPVQKYWYVPETAVQAVKAAWRASRTTF